MRRRARRSAQTLGVVLRVFAFTLIIALAGCAGSGDAVKARVAHWQQTFDENVPPGTEYFAAVKWAQAHGLALTDESQGRELGGTLEIFPAPFWSLACSKYIIQVDVKFDASGRSVENAVSSYGYCL
jgi:hypothetical protein